ncbi:MAG: hypothetical protein KH828_01175 [Clostridiales bacterium]|nr:hypothetical protein [Clostridiales bacterium]
MVTGFESFRRHFKRYENEYVIIGGTACDLIMSEENLPFRATKDIDMVLLVEALTAEFVKRLWDYIKEAEYEHQNKSTGEPQFYRFSHPKSKEYPFMIELFSRRMDALALDSEAQLTPLPMEDEISSLSAILLNEAYYEFLKQGKMIIEGVPVLKTEYIIPFKAKAWLDLKERKENGEHVDSKNIRKHKNDVFRMAVLISEERRMDIRGEIKKDMEQFLEKMKRDKTDIKSLGIAGKRQEELIQVLERCYILRE